MACSLVAINEFRALCPSQVDATELAVGLALQAASTAAERYANRTFAEATVTEYYDGNGYPNLPLNKFPISSVTTVYVDTSGGYGQITNTFGASTLLTAGQDYAFVAEQGFLQVLAGRSSWPMGTMGPGFSPYGWRGLTRHGTSWVGWPRVPGCIKVTYVGGYNPIPADLKMAVCSMASYILLATNAGGMVTTTQSYIDTSVGSGFLSEALARGNVPALGSARLVLDSYRDIAIARGCF